MTRIRLAVVLLPILVCAAALWAADKPIVGTWDCTSTTPGGSGEIKWTLTIKEENGKLVGTAVSDEGETPVTDATYENDTLTFKVVVDAETYVIELKVSGHDKLDGSWKGAGESGSIKGTRKA